MWISFIDFIAGFLAAQPDTSAPVPTNGGGHIYDALFRVHKNIILRVFSWILGVLGGVIFRP